MSKSDSIRSVERAIDLLQSLGRRPHSTLQDLHLDTGFPKPTIRRLLRTLEASGFAAQPSSYGAYRLLGTARSLCSGFHHEPMLLEVAEGIMIDFTRREGWPLAMALLDCDAVAVRACTIPHTSLSLDHSMLNKRLSLSRSALGRAYLGSTVHNERKFLIEILRRSAERNGDAPFRTEEIEHVIQQVRERGYAMRDPLDRPRSSTIAVPIRIGGRVLASLGLTWITAAMPRKKAVERFVPHLFAIASRIAAEIPRLRRDNARPASFPAPIAVPLQEHA